MRCRLLLTYMTGPCPNDATGADELCDECRQELDEIRRANADDDAARGYHDDRDFRDHADYYERIA